MLKTIGPRKSDETPRADQRGVMHAAAAPLRCPPFAPQSHTRPPVVSELAPGASNIRRIAQKVMFAAERWLADPNSELLGFRRLRLDRLWRGYRRFHRLRLDRLLLRWLRFSLRHGWQSWLGCLRLCRLRLDWLCLRWLRRNGLGSRCGARSLFNRGSSHIHADQEASGT
jgi:hypothetical protein